MSITPQQRKNVETWIEILREVPPDQFDMEDWYLSGPTCGTTACALGWAALSDKLPEFSMIFYEGYYHKCREYFIVSGVTRDYAEAMELLFGIHVDDAAWFVMPAFYDTAESSEVTTDMVIARLEEFLAGQDA